MDVQEEKIFVAQLGRMDEAAWEEFCLEYSRLLGGFIRCFQGHNREEAEEIVQMTFIRCVRSIRTFDPKRGRLFDWLKAVARNESNTFRSRASTHGREVPHSALPPGVADRIVEGIDQALLPDELLEREDVRWLIQETLAALNSKFNRVLVLKYLDGRKVSDIAESLGVSEKAAESVLTRARDAFRAEFTKRTLPGQVQEKRHHGDKNTVQAI